MSDRTKLPFAHILKKIKVKHSYNSSFIVNLQCACTAEGYTTWFVCLSVCLSVTSYSGNTGHVEADERYKRVLSYEGKKTEKAIFLKQLRSRYMPLKQPMCIIHWLTSICSMYTINHNRGLIYMVVFSSCRS